jgi:hypothetical protein
VADVAPVAAGLCNDILKLPLAIVCVHAVNCALLVVFSSCTVNIIIELAVTVLFVTVNSALVAAANADAANVILPEVALIVTPVAWFDSCVTVPVPVCTRPLAAWVITKLPVSTDTFCPSAATVNPAVGVPPV